MPEFLQSLANHLQELGSAAYLLVFAVVLLETIILMGHFIPGGVFIAFVGFLCYLQVFDFAGMFLVVFLSHYLGEVLNYALGRTKGRTLFREDARWLKLTYLETAERRFRQGGPLIVVTGQFLGVFRPILSFVAGASRYSRVKFFGFMLVGAFLWTLLHLGIGFLLGASWEQAAEVLEGFSLLLIAVVLSVWISAWLISLAVENAGQMGGWLENASRRIHASAGYNRIAARSPRLFRFLEARVSLSRRWGMGATAGWMLVALLAAVLALILKGVHGGDTWHQFDYSLVNLVAQLRSQKADVFFQFFTHLGDGWSVFLLSLVAAAVCLATGQRRSAVVILGAVLLTGALGQTIKFTYARARPDTAMALVAESGFSFPSGHSSMSVAFLGGLYYWLWNHPGRMRLWIGTAFGLLVSAFLVGFSRIYLGVHYPSDVLAGFCVGLIALVVTATVAHNLPGVADVPRRADFAALVLFVSALALSGVKTAVVRRKAPETSPTRPSRVTDCPTTQTLMAALPRDGFSLMGARLVPVNVVVLGDAAAVRSALEAKGWRTVPPKAFLTREVAAPIFPVFVEERPAEWTLEQRSGWKRGILRLWPAAQSLGGRPVWVGCMTGEKARASAFGLRVFHPASDMDLALDYLQSALAGLPGVGRAGGFRGRDLYPWRYPFFTHGDALWIETGKWGRP